MKISHDNPTAEPIVEDTFAEAFPMTGARLVVTTDSTHWANVAAQVFCGYATSVIGCDLEAGVERLLDPAETPDGRPGVSILAFGFSRDALAKSLVNRVGQCLLTCPTTAVFDGLPEIDRDRSISIGGQIRFFGDGYQASKVIGGNRYWRVPVMDGEFLCQDRFGTVKGVAGGNLLIGAKSSSEALQAAEAAVVAIRKVRDVILPFPGGIVRSGSKVGSRYRAMKASTNEAYCPTLRGRVDSMLPENTRAMYEIVIDGLSLESVQTAMQVALFEARRAAGVTYITAGNYGGKLGPHHIALRDLNRSDQKGSP